MIDLIRSHATHLVLIWMLGSSVVFAQTITQPKDPDVGDKLVYKWMKNNKPVPFEQEVTAVSGDQVRGVERVAGKESELEWTKTPFSISKGVCMSTAEACTYEPAIEFLHPPVDKGKKWEGKFTVKSAEFTAQVEREYNVEGSESVKVPAGEFQAYRVHYQSRYRGTTTKGAVFNGRDEGTLWFALSSGKLVVAKQEYKNSTGEKSVRELASVAFK